MTEISPPPRCDSISQLARDRIRIEELLEEIYVLTEAGTTPTLASIAPRLDDPDPSGALDEAARLGLVAREPDGTVAWRPDGEALARGIIRRHRLAEVLFAEVLEVSENDVEPSACVMEHILSTGVTDSVCAFLGHPPRCPHGRAIPPGDCCRTLTRSMEPLVVPLANLGPGTSARVVFISPRKSARLGRLAGFGILPGARLRLRQSSPSYVAEIGETTLAFEREIASEIYVRREDEPAS